MIYYCEWCDIEIAEDQARMIIEDDAFSAPYGDQMGYVGGGQYLVATCPMCKEYIKEVVES